MVLWEKNEAVAVCMCVMAQYGRYFFCLCGDAHKKTTAKAVVVGYFQAALHALNHRFAKGRARNFVRTFHQAGEVVGYLFVANGFFHGMND